ncbi:D-alanyl-D-alanine carboxypeptidase family protein [Patescibacteria group bacterium]
MVDLYLVFLMTLFHLDSSDQLASLTFEEKTLVIDELLMEAPSIGIGNIIRAIPPISLEPYVYPPAISAEAAVVVDPVSGKILWEKNRDTQRPIASLTKLMTVAAVLDTMPDLSQEVTISREDLTPRIGSWLRVSEGEIVTLNDLLSATLVGSMNNAAEAFVRGAGLSEEDCVFQMNTKAQSLGMAHTMFVDVTGLDPENISTPTDLVRLVAHVFSYEKILQTVLQPTYEFRTIDSDRVIHFSSTNALLDNSSFTFRGAKTGFLDEAGYTFAAYLEQDDKQVITALLGAPSASARFTETTSLAEWAFRTHTWFSFFTSPPK